MTAVDDLMRRSAGMRSIVLASTSPYRRALLARLGVPFTTRAPEVDEGRWPGESAEDLVVRLAAAKAWAVARDYRDALVIGSDQAACLDGRVLGKPGDRDRAIAQLEQASGRCVTFLTGLCLVAPPDGSQQCCCEPCHVHFRTLTRAQIEAYVDRERPFDCAGSFKAEGLGIALFEHIDGADPTALIGLPLIRLVRMFSAAGVDVLTAAGHAASN